MFDRHPDLQVIAGHWGEVVLFYLDHVGVLQGMAGLRRPLADYFRASSFLENAPFTEEEKAAIGSGNWERLTGGGVSGR